MASSRILIALLPLLTIILISMEIHRTDALVCTENFCAGVTCTVNATSCEKGQHLLGSVCGCCYHCVNDIPENGSCRDLGGLTVPWNTQCAEGLVCCNKEICRKPANCKS